MKTTICKSAFYGEIKKFGFIVEIFEFFSKISSLSNKTFYYYPIFIVWASFKRKLRFIFKYNDISFFITFSYSFIYSILFINFIFVFYLMHKVTTKVGLILTLPVNC